MKSGINKMSCLLAAFFILWPAPAVFSVIKVTEKSDSKFYKKHEEDGQEDG